MLKSTWFRVSHTTIWQHFDTVARLPTIGCKTLLSWHFLSMQKQLCPKLSRLVEFWGGFSQENFTQNTLIV